ncbi:MAG: radical SAM protein, partial [Muribaculaceae bacterium]|nr:radical SAM protein [Muribaculaceae bacterium]
MNRRENVCKYLDIALQHISDKVLSNMRRHITKEETLALLAEIRRRVPDIKIRTTLMTGFPGEDEEAFEELKEFVRSQRFDRMGAFAYSEEEDTYAARHLEDNVDPEVKQKRLDEIMEMQESISDELNVELVGREVKVLVDSVDEDQITGRTQWDSPEVDPEVLMPVPEEMDINPGDFLKVKITASYPFELAGEILEKLS